MCEPRTERYAKTPMLKVATLRASRIRARVVRSSYIRASSVHAGSVRTAYSRNLETRHSLAVSDALERKRFRTSHLFARLQREYLYLSHVGTLARSRGSAEF